MLACQGFAIQEKILLREVKSEGIDIICIPGACAAITALVSSGLPSSSFVFEGFLPKKAN